MKSYLRRSTPLLPFRCIPDFGGVTSYIPHRPRRSQTHSFDLPLFYRRSFLITSATDPIQLAFTDGESSASPPIFAGVLLYKKTGGVTHKSDIYSFGVVLFEVLSGRSAVLPDEELGEGLLSQLAKSRLDDMIDPYLPEQMDPEAFKIFSDTAYWCIKEDRADRPYIDQVVKRLEKALELQWKHENPVNRTSSIQLKVRN
ncbi:kinase-like domain, phloem protein 2-like protein [Tanacetum coccineum]